MHMIQSLIDNVERVILGKRSIIELSLVALLSEGHILLEDVPGVGKTALVKAIATSIDASFSRIQFTPDLLPADITGVSIYHPEHRTFQFEEGPIFGGVVLADELNRASPKTQSALLESMEERSLTVDGKTYDLPEPFFVMATQNPIEHQGTYPLPEAQLDRFLFLLTIGYPSEEEEIRLVLEEEARSADELRAVCTVEDVLRMQKEVRDVHVAENIATYIVQLVRATREHEAIALGMSPRSTIAYMRAAQAYAYVKGRSFVTPDDVQQLFPPIARHRLLIRRDAAYNGVTSEQIIDDILQLIPVPVEG